MSDVSIERNMEVLMEEDKIKRYIVFMQDEWNNLYWIGEFNKLENSISDINDWLSNYQDIKIDELNEYPGTFGPCFDKIIEIDEDGQTVSVRGFILEDEK